MMDSLTCVRPSAKGQKDPMFIERMGFKARCKEAGIAPSNMTPANRKAVSLVPPIFIDHQSEDFRIEHCIAMDIETCSLQSTGGVFMVYAVGWKSIQQGSDQLVAETEQQIESSWVLMEALKAWEYIAHLCGLRRKTDGRRIMYVYAHNNSGFDGVAVIHSILSNFEEPLDDLLVSNRKYISFRWKNLIFRDSMLIATSSLDEAAKAYDIPESKGYLPHSYLQNCSSLAEILRRINNPVPWEKLDSHVDWFHEVKKDDLQKRVAGRTFEAWKEEQPIRKEFHEHVKNKNIL